MNYEERRPNTGGCNSKRSGRREAAAETAVERNTGTDGRFQIDNLAWLDSAQSLQVVPSAHPTPGQARRAPTPGLCCEALSGGLSRDLANCCEDAKGYSASRFFKASNCALISAGSRSPNLA